MREFRRINIIVVGLVLLLGACKSVPENAQYIPADAVTVTSVNLSSLSKKIAWELLTGSRFFKKMKERMPEGDSSANVLKGIENAGIDVVNTFYVYSRADVRFEGGSIFVGLVPLSDKAAFERYLKSTFDGITIVTDEKGRSTAALGHGLYAGWKTDLLVVLRAAATDGTDDDAVLKAELDKAFEVPGNKPITKDKRYQTFAREGYDFSFWLNYGQLASDINDNTSMGMNGLSLSPDLAKGGVLVSGINFERGKVTGDLNYYLPTKLRGAGSSVENLDKVMLDRMPKENVDLVHASHIPPATVQAILEKAGLYGLSNLALSSMSLDVDYVLDAFSGDIVMSMNDFSLQTELREDEFMGEVVQHKKQKANMKMTYAIKLNKKENFMKLVGLAMNTGLQKANYGYVFPLTTKDSVFLMFVDAYAVISNSRKHAAGFVSGENTKSEFPDGMREAIYGHPYACYIDVRRLMKNVDPTITGSATDSAMIQECKNLIDNVTINGGDYSEDAYRFSLEVNFMNKDESSLLELVDFGARLKEISDIQSQ